ncbi:MAG: hypothetical protein Q4G70_03120 [Pseudomonadota bacterium]|nr:hypothetical protein [Pseudomonadota bacterium]
MMLLTRVDTFATYCCNLPEPYNALGGSLMRRLEQRGWTSSVAELTVNMMYPAHRAHKSLQDELGTYAQWYAKLPLVRWTKQRSHVSVTLAAPGLAPAMRRRRSESDWVPAAEMVEVDAGEQGGVHGDTEHAAILAAWLDAMGQVADLIERKCKPGDVFDGALFRQTLDDMRALDEAQCRAISGELERQRDDSVLAFAHAYREERRQQAAARTEAPRRLIQDIRFYFRLDGYDYALFGSDLDLCGNILRRLRVRKFRLPRYTDLYVQVAQTPEEALRRSGRPPLTWYVSGPAVLADPAAFARLPAPQKRRQVFGLIETALMDIATIDRLDIATLRDVLDEVARELEA